MIPASTLLGPASRTGAHTSEVLAALGYAADEIAALVDAGAIGLAAD